MIVNKFSSIKEVIEGVYRDIGSQEELPFEDMLYWSYEVLELIGNPIQYIKKITGNESDPNLEITNYRAKLPCDFHKLIAISVEGLPARYSGNTFHHLLDGECCGFSANVVTDNFVDQFGNTFSPQAPEGSSYISSDMITFDINNEYITLSVKEAAVCISYLAYPLDKSGWPMIPDDVKYKLAIKNYLNYKLSYLNWRKDPDSRGKQAIYQEAKREYEWYIASASNHAKMPSVSEMESLKNQIIRLVPNISEYDSYFRNLGAKYRKRLH